MKNKILIIDIETTGLFPSNSKIVEVGIVELDIKTGAKRILFDSVVHERPITLDEVQKSWIVSNGFMTVEEIRKSPQLKDKIVEIQNIIDAYAEGATAYNNAFDFGFLENRGIKFHKKLPCPMLLSTDILKLPARMPGTVYKYPTVQEAWNHYFGTQTGYIEKHRGADDAFHEADIVFELIKRNQFFNLYNSIK